jgi:hypothetical protein
MCVCLSMFLPPPRVVARANLHAKHAQPFGIQLENARPLDAAGGLDLFSVASLFTKVPRQQAEA